MKRAVTPKLIPNFTLLVAGSGIEPVSLNTTGSHLDVRLLEHGRQVAELLASIVESSPLLYGKGSGVRTSVTLLTGGVTDVATQSAISLAQVLDLPIRLITCGEHQRGLFSNYARDGIHLEIPEHDLELQSKLPIIHEENLRAFADMLFWLGDSICHQTNNSRVSRLFANSVLDAKPILWLHNDGAAYLLDHDLLDEPERLLLQSGEASPELVAALFKPFNDTHLHAECQFIVNPALKISRSSPRVAGQNIFDYFTERGPSKFSSGMAGRIDKLINALVSGNSFFKILFTGAGKPWYGVDVPRALIDSGHHTQEPDGLKARFEWSDRIANVTSGLRRDITWCLYLFSSFAVFAAVAGAINIWPENLTWFWPVIEMLIILAIVTLYGWASHSELHSRWLFHRFLAEQLRYARFGYPLLSFQTPLLAPLRLTIPDANGLPKSQLISAENWLLKRTLVASGLPKIRNQPIYHPVRLIKPIHHYVINVIKDQCHYHQNIYHTLHTVEHRLHGLTKLAFILTAAAVAAHFYLHAHWLLIFTAALPSLAAAIYGIVTTTEMGRTSAMSLRTNRELHHCIKSLKRLDLHEADSLRTWVQMREITHHSASVMSNVNQQWQDLIQHHETSLPV